MAKGWEKLLEALVVGELRGWDALWLSCTKAGLEKPYLPRQAFGLPPAPVSFSCAAVCV